MFVQMRPTMPPSVVLPIVQVLPAPSDWAGCLNAHRAGQLWSSGLGRLR